MQMQKPLLKDSTQQSNAKVSIREETLSPVAQALEAYERRYQFLFENMADAIYITTLDGRLVDTNQAGLEMFGYTREELIDLPIRELYANPEDREAFIEAAQAKRTLKDYAMRMRRKDGTTFCCMLTNTLWRDEAGTLLGFQGIIRDVTELKRAEATIHAHAAELEERNQELDAFAHTIAHDLKAPLQAILLALELVLDEADQLSEMGHQMMAVARQATRKAGKMVDSLMQFAVLRDAQEVIAPVDMNKVAEAAVERMQHHIQEREATVKIEGPLLPVMGHGPWLEEVVANLVSNAVKYIGRHNPDPTIRIRTVAVDGQVRTEIEDNGLGITEEDLQKLFTKFVRFHNGEAEGSGIGLSIVARIIKRLGGAMDVKSAVGEGSTFSFTLPAATNQELDRS